jgi:hypothetical protein
MSQQSYPPQGQAPQKECPNCGGSSDANAAVCQWCGTPFPQPVAPPPAQYPPQYPQNPQYPQYPPPQQYGQPGPYQQPYYPYANPQNMVRRRWGCILLPIILALVICGALAAYGAALRPGTTSLTFTQPGESQQQPISGSSTTKIGQSVNVGSWKVTVEKAQKTKSIDWSGLGSTEDAKGVFVKVYVTAQNVTNKTDSIKSFDYKLHDSSGAEYDACISFACIAYPNQEKRDNFSSSTPPRSSTKLLALFDVATDAQGLELVIEDSAHISLGNVALQP